MDADGGPKSSLPPSASSTPRTSSPIRFVSPLRSFTVFDKADGNASASTAAAPASPRRRFLPKFRAGLVAEKRARDAIAEELRASLLEGADDDDYAEGGRGWAEMEAAKEELRRAADEVRVERAYDRAVVKYDKKKKTGGAARRATAGGDYQFVGVAAPPGGGAKTAVTWYARRKPAGSKWSVRMVHVDRDAVVKDMFSRGEVDVYGKYVNTGKTVVDGGGKDGEERETNVPVLKGQYSVKNRSWRTLWNFSPIRLFSDSSGMYWRERRLSPGLYTDGRTVFESAYDYSDGRNGMRPMSSLDAYLKSGGVKAEAKTEVLRRLKEDGPDVVVEE